GPTNAGGTFDVSGFNVVTPIFLYGGNAADSFSVHAALFKNLYIYAQGSTSDSLVIDDRSANPGIFRTSLNGNLFEQDYGLGPASYTAYGVNFYGVESRSEERRVGKERRWE